MALARLPCWSPDKLNKRVTCLFRVSIWAGMANTARSVQFFSCNARQANARTFGAPNGSIAIPDPRRRALKRLPCRNDSCGKDECQKHQCATQLYIGHKINMPPTTVSKNVNSNFSVNSLTASPISPLFGLRLTCQRKERKAPSLHRRYLTASRHSHSG